MTATIPDALWDAAQRAAGEHLREMETLVRLLREGADGGDTGAVAATLSRMRMSLEEWMREINASHNRVLAIHTHRLASERYSDAWWHEQSTRLRDEFEAAPGAANREWVRIYVAALLAGELETCLRLGDVHPAAPEPERQLRERLVAAAQALEHGNPGAAAPVCSGLLRATWSTTEPVLADSAHRAAVLVLIGRIQLWLGREVAARAHFEAAIDLAPREALPRCGLGDYWTAQQRQRRAESCYQEAVELQLLSEERPDDLPRADPFLGLARIAEQRGAWDEAEDWHHEAVAIAMRAPHPQRLLEALLAPVNGAVLWRLAQGLLEHDPLGAVAAVDAALAWEIEWAGQKRGGELQLLRAQALKTLEDPGTAAAYTQAGSEFLNETRPAEAISALRKARELGGDDASIQWDLADAHRMRAMVALAEGHDASEELGLAVAAWEDGYGIRAPRVEEAWTYVARAVISDRLGTAPNEDRWSRTWEAVEYMERSILRGGGYMTLTSPLCDLLGRLRLDACALWTSERTLQAGPDEEARFQRAVALAELGRVEEARSVMGEMRDQGGESAELADYLEATVEVAYGKAEVGLAYFDSRVQTGEASLLDRSMRATALRQLGEPDRAAQEYWFILNDREHQTPDDVNEVAYAAYSVADYGEARAKTQLMLVDRLRDRVWALLLAGLVALAEGAIEEGLERCREAMSSATSPLELDRYVRELRELAARAATWPHANALGDTVALLLKDADVHREMAAARARRTPEQELTDALEEIPADDTCARRAAQAVLARWSAETGALDRAAERYRSLDDSRWPLELEGIADLCLAEARRSLALGQTDDARRYAVGCAAFLDQRYPDDLDRRSAAAALSVLVELVQGSELDALRDLTAALARDDHSDSSFAAPLGAALRSTLTASLTPLEATSRFWAYERLLQSVEQASPALRERIQAVRSQLHAYLDDSLGLTPAASREETRRPTVELGLGLVAADTGPSWTLFSTYVPEMRQRVFEHSGVVVSGVLFRSNEALSAGGYRILLDEVTESAGEVPLHECYVQLDQGAQLPDLDAKQATPQAHPVTKALGYWVTDTDAARLEENGAQVWRDPLLFVVAETEAVIRRHLSEHLSLENLDDLLDLWAKAEAEAAAVAQSVPDVTARVELAQTLRALVAEGVPVLDGSIIVPILAQPGFHEAPREARLRALRHGLRAQLPGNAPGWHLVELPDFAEAPVAPRAYGEPGTPPATSTAAETMKALVFIRGLLESASEPAALIVQDSERRSAIRRLIESEFPDVPVLSAEELLLSPAAGLAAESVQPSA